MTCELASRFLTRKRSRTIRDFHRQSRSRALLYPKTLARRWRYNITKGEKVKASRSQERLRRK